MCFLDSSCFGRDKALQSPPHHQVLTLLPWLPWLPAQSTQVGIHLHTHSLQITPTPFSATQFNYQDKCLLQYRVLCSSTRNTVSSHPRHNTQNLLTYSDSWEPTSTINYTSKQKKIRMKQALKAAALNLWAAAPWGEHISAILHTRYLHCSS